ncbi:hypothetical protein GUITHDRAFT_115294 [Guillardia theta CCMP2712]|uniref:Uncharacterized protein n=1 Tax=Guillardia theta (strain CCMP2712) TaxID=905079 RepID=L1IQE2_GUITC|nr:hypothetical protein GUITHDRAFT_115294 [Guillardia theta CCMP2712]EKX38516.1 hypothetical protein GUITHDRAFT_115294 [Guillardia theta CCMP2712]|eukprot:XP_005825496.1 hypothetical protein GUITHDRAFT_115294 [Guillardia theta CCMP2712]
MRLSEASFLLLYQSCLTLSRRSARMALLANVPVICEDSLHFADLENTVELAPLEEIPRRIREVVSNEELRRHIVERQKQFVAKWPPSEIQARHRALYDQLRPKHMPGELPPDYIEKAAMPAEESDEANKLRDEMNKFVDSPIRNLADEEEEDSEFAKFRSEKIREHLRRSNLRGDKRIKDAA